MFSKPIFFPLLPLLFLLACTHRDGVYVLPVDPPDPEPFAVYTNVVYGDDSLQQDMDVYLPPHRDTVNTPVIILIHGGAWVQGDKTDFTGSGLDTFFTANGCAVVNINYRLDGSYKYPAPLDDIGLVMAFLQRQSKAWRINPGRVCLLGKSSGSQLALMYAYSRNEGNKIKAIIDGYGPTNFVDTSVVNKALAVNVAVLLGPYAANERSWHDASPIFYMAGCVPTVIFQGTEDEEVYPVQSQMLADSLEARGMPYMYIPWVGDKHGWDQPKWIQWRTQVMTWVRYFL